MNRRIKRTLLEDVKIIYFAIPCHSRYCEYCKNILNNCDSTIKDEKVDILSNTINK